MMIILVMMMIITIVVGGGFEHGAIHAAAAASAAPVIGSPLYITKRQLLTRWGRSHMFLERLLKSDPDFPKPVKLGPTETAWWMWSVEAIENYERLCAARSIPARTAAPKRRRRADPA
jgi:predicted DNA-binding transcriptional regulator AlpA